MEHLKDKPEWEERFDEIYANVWKPGHKHDETCEFTCSLRGQVKDFIRRETSLAKEQGRKDAVEYIRSTVPPYDELTETPRMYIDRSSFERILLQAATPPEPST